MYQHGRASGAGFAAGVMTGACLGAAVALLHAPKSGAALRDQIGESAASMRDAVTRRYQALAARAGVAWEHVRRSVDVAADAIVASARETVAQAAGVVGSRGSQSR
jgi:gas vesicle protein